MRRPYPIRMTSDECKPLHKLEAKRRKAIDATADELHRLISVRATEYTRADATAQALFDTLLAYDGETAVEAARAFIEGCGFEVKEIAS